MYTSTERALYVPPARRAAALQAVVPDTGGDSANAAVTPPSRFGSTHKSAVHSRTKRAPKSAGSFNMNPMSSALPTVPNTGDDQGAIPISSDEDDDVVPICHVPESLKRLVGVCAQVRFVNAVHRQQPLPRDIEYRTSGFFKPAVNTTEQTPVTSKHATRTKKNCEKVFDPAWDTPSESLFHAERLDKRKKTVRGFGNQHDVGDEISSRQHVDIKPKKSRQDAKKNVDLSYDSTSSLMKTNKTNRVGFGTQSLITSDGRQVMLSDTDDQDLVAKLDKIDPALVSAAGLPSTFDNSPKLGTPVGGRPSWSPRTKLECNTYALADDRAFTSSASAACKNSYDEFMKDEESTKNASKKVCRLNL